MTWLTTNVIVSVMNIFTYILLEYSFSSSKYKSCTSSYKEGIRNLFIRIPFVLFLDQVWEKFSVGIWMCHRSSEWMRK